MNEEDKKYNVRVKVIVAVMITFIITLCGTVVVYDKYLSYKGLIIEDYESSGDIANDINLLKTVIEKKYKGEIDDSKLEQAALKGYIEGLGDEYTEFLTQDEWDDLDSSLSDFVGIGVYMSQLKNSSDAVIIGVIDDDTPAGKAGIQAGDIIKEVDGEDVSGKGTEYVSSKVKGPEGTKVSMKVLRGDQEIEFTMTREQVKVYKIKHEMLENNIGYIDFDSFTDTSADEFKEAYNDLKNNGATSLIVDLRNNTGGYVKSALEIADLFVDSGKTLLITEDKDGNKTVQKSSNGKTIDMPVVVLVNEYTASASEILTGIFKDYGIAKVVGTKTYGKGVIQEVYPDVLGTEIGGALKVTVSEYFTPNENKINKIGIIPDVEIELNEDDSVKRTKENDAQLQKAIELLK
jgi:carboxyl-terminal processing protease